MRILLIEDDPAIAAFVRQGLTEEGHAVAVATRADDARTQHALEPAELLLLDRRLPDGDGLDLLRSLRADGDTTPVIVLTARDGVEDRVEGLRAGADDYLVKPFAFAELLARLDAVHRRAAPAGARPPTDVLQFGPVRVDLVALRVFCDAQEVRLTATEFRLLRHLAEHAGQVCTRTRLLDAVWDTHHDPGTNLVDVYVSYVRARLADAGAPSLIHTVRGRGFVWELRSP